GCTLVLLGGADCLSPPGCRFDRRLCSPQEICVPDGLFGQCQDSTVRDRPYFQVTSPVLQRLQGVLRHLMAQGLSWQDGITQYVISQELARIPRLRPPPPWIPRRSQVTPVFQPVTHSLLGNLDQPSPGFVRPLVMGTSRHPRLPFLRVRKIPPLPPRPPPPNLNCPCYWLNPFLLSCCQQPWKTAAIWLLYHKTPKNIPTAPPRKAVIPPTSLAFPGLPISCLQEIQPLPALDCWLPQAWGSVDQVPMRTLSLSLPPTEVALQRLVAVLAGYGVGLQALSPWQLSKLSALLQLLQRSGECCGLRGSGVGEGTAAARVSTEGPRWEVAAVPVHGSSKPTLSQTERQVPGQAGPRDPAGGQVLSPDRQVPVEKKSYPEPGGHGEKGEQQETQHAEEYGYIVTDQKPLGLAAGVRLLEMLAEHVHLSTASFINISVVGSALTFRVRQNQQNLSLADVTNQAAMVKAKLEAELGLKIVQTGVGQRNDAASYPRPSHFRDTFHSVLLTFLALACVAGVVIAGAIVLCLRQHAKQREKDRLAALGPEGAGDGTFEYQELCRQHMAARSLFGRTEAPPAPAPAPAPAENSRVSSISSQFSDAAQASPSSHSSTPSWCEEPVQSNMDISTGHMILAYMEDHLRNRDRLAQEWKALCAYQAEPNVCSAAQSEANLKKNRNPDYVPYDHARIKLKAESNPSRSDFINASPIIEHDPRMPAYIATQGPLSHTIADFWQMVWENGCTVIVMLSPLVEDGVKQCDRYWPDEGSSLYHIYEVNLVSEHIWCEDFLVRSFYLKNVQSQETRTLTQFHFLSWPAEGLPATTRPLLDFRRKVNKCYRGRSCPVIVHCSNGAGRTGTYILIDMVLNRMAKGVKEIDIAATLEHVRDQRPGMVQTKDQFEFALTAVAEEVNAILKALPQ
uniref:Protein tyrosine phosphatase receptor type N n=1 Tax=Pelusios castaneus TaxID=367368 RepID=A0A8C8SFT2_9SAUR